MNAFFRPTALLLMVPGLTAVGLGWAGWNRASSSERTSAGSSRLLVVSSEENRVIQQRLVAKNRVIDSLLAEEMNLQEAAAWFRFLNDNPPEFPCDFRERTPGRDEGEKACRQVLQWVRTRLPLQLPESQGTALVHHLESQLDALLADSDSVELPW